MRSADNRFHREQRPTGATGAHPITEHGTTRCPNEGGIAANIEDDGTCSACGASVPTGATGAERGGALVADCQAALGCVKDTGEECARTLCNAGIPDRHCDRCKTESLGLSSSAPCLCRPGSCGWCEAGLTRTTRHLSGIAEQDPQPADQGTPLTEAERSAAIADIKSVLDSNYMQRQGTERMASVIEAQFAEREAAARADERERIAQAIEALTCWQGLSPATIRDRAARIARAGGAQ